MFLSFIIFLISLIPLNLIKVFLLNTLPNISVDKRSKIGFALVLMSKNVKILNSKIGNFNFIECKNFEINNSKIANSNIILKINKFKANNFSIVGSHNLIRSEKEEKKVYIKMNNSQLSSNFRLDLSKNLYLGEKVILGGINTKIIDETKDNITKTTILLKNIFIGSNVIIKNGIRLKKNIVVGANTLIDKDIYISGKYFSKNLEIF